MRGSYGKYHFVLFLFIVLSAASASAQKTVWSKPDDLQKKALKKVDKGKKKVKLLKDHIRDWGLDEGYVHQLSLGAQLNTNGWTGGVFYWKKIDALKSNVFSLRFSEIKHEKQIKQQDNNPFPELGRPEPYVFGKVNNLYTVQLGFGREYIVLPSVAEGNIDVGLRFSGGLSIAMLKPYYLKLIYTDYTSGEPVAELRELQYSEDSEAFLKNGNKLASASWTKGIGEMRYVPGGFLDAAVVIQPEVTAWFVQTVTIGANAAYYAKPLEIMADKKAYPYQVSLYVGLAIGKRW